MHQNENRSDQHNCGGLKGCKNRLDDGPSHREHRGLWRGKLYDERLLLRPARRSHRIGLSPSRPDGWHGYRGGRRRPPVEEPRDGRETVGGKSLDVLQLVLDGLDIMRTSSRALRPDSQAVPIVLMALNATRIPAPPPCHNPIAEGLHQRRG